MSGTPPPTRKKPRCRSCGTPMAGHRRVSGRCVCPDDTSNKDTETTTPSPRRSVRLDSPPREQQTPRPPSPTRLEQTNRDPRSCPKNASCKYTPSLVPCKTEDESDYTEKAFVESPALPQQCTSRIEPTNSFSTFVRGVRLSRPLASIFTIPKSDIEEVQREAVKHGLYTGMVYKPRKIKEEESQRWIVLGGDPDAVDRMVDCQRKDVARQLKLESPIAAPVPAFRADTVAAPINVICGGPSSWRMFVVLLSTIIIGGTMLFYMYVYT